MTPKEKATQLIYAFEAFTDEENEFEFAKQCALIAVDEILFVLNECEDTYSENASQFYNEVKQEISNL
tara:strand:+ start:824 stop:1027 length:204 start_codon:yes stop_codon:yes gene_type:complete